MGPQEQEDRKRIAHLLALTQPVEQEVTYFRGAKPDKMTVFPRSASGIPQPHGSQGADAGGSNKNNQRSGSPERVMRTVYLPSANTDAMMLKIESLQVECTLLKRGLSFLSLCSTTKARPSAHLCV